MSDVSIYVIHHTLAKYLPKSIDSMRYEIRGSFRGMGPIKTKTLQEQLVLQFVVCTFIHTYLPSYSANWEFSGFTKITEHYYAKLLSIPNFQSN